MRECRICGDNKPLSEYHRNGTGHRTECKSCKSTYFKKRKRIRDGHYTLYYIPEHHYVGMTNCLKDRMQEHRSKGKKITDGFEVIATFDRAVDCHLMETKLHAMGYEGFNYKNHKKNG